ncbi:hypothetical protein ET495_09825 [Xylanimonas allomyrinae]|uniref:Uncharacterized protein n=1 Tax=Xylanimonas allomyrinae TaxID=2509459 RepID=A0A4P6ELJ2_9MICO|nr:hypothetical protein [Xylanimonas allomyrinae]QAY63502.1 hypothetical protein ET495_09825 [Xylanimonas allomyrinae]
MTPGPRVPLRASGYLAMLAVVLFAVVGTIMLVSGDTPRGPFRDALVVAGGRDPVPAGTQRVVWGVGAALVPADVVCTVTLATGETRDVDTTALGPDRPTAQVAGFGTATQLGVTMRTRDGDLSCAGGGLERFATADRRGGPPGAVLAVFFYVLAAVAALWALATLGLRRSAR